MSIGNFNTINSRLIFSFSVIGILILSLIGFTLYKITTVVGVSREVVVNKQPSQIYTLMLNNGFHESNEALRDFLLFKDTSYQAKREEIWKNQISPAIDSLYVLSAGWHKPSHLVLFKQIEKQLAVVKSQQEKIEQRESTELFQASILPLSEKLNTDFKALNNSLLEEKKIMRTGIYDEIASFKIVEAIFVILVLIVVLMLYRFNRKKILESVNKVKNQMYILGKGGIPSEQISTKGDELDIIMDEINILSENLKNVKAFALEVGKGEFDSDVNVFNNEGEVGSSLAQMRDSLKQVSLEDKQRSWANEGFARFSELIRNNGENLQDLSEQLIIQLVKYLGANQGGLFIVDNNREEAVLQLKACYAYNRKKYINKEVIPGEGLVGQAWLEQDIIYLTDVPQDFINITSGLGHATPNAVLIVPMKMNDKVYGIIELASFNEFEAYEKEFVKRVAETIASAISSVKVNEHTKRLLEESQVMTEQLKSQEEEMRQNMEELQATQEEMRRKNDEVQLQFARMNAILDSSADAIITTNEKGKLETANKSATTLFGLSESELLEKSVRDIVSEYGELRKNFLSLKPGQAIKMNAEAVHSSGKLIPVEFALSLIVVNEKPIFTTIIRDISKQVEMEAERERTIQELQIKQGEMEEQQEIMKASEEMMHKTLSDLMEKEQNLQENAEEMRAQEEELRQNLEELNATQEEMEKVSHRLDAELTALNNAIAKVEFNAEGKIIEANENFLKIMKFELDEIIHKPLSVFFKEEDRTEENFNQFMEMLKEGKVLEGEHERINKQGESVYIHTTYTPIFNRKGQLEKIINITYDLTDIKNNN